MYICDGTAKLHHSPMVLDELVLGGSVGESGSRERESERPATHYKNAERCEI
jgi:hypothetical protein